MSIENGGCLLEVKLAAPNRTWHQASTNFNKLALSNVRPIDKNYGSGRMGPFLMGQR